MSFVNSVRSSRRGLLALALALVIGATLVVYLASSYEAKADEADRLAEPGDWTVTAACYTTVPGYESGVWGLEAQVGLEWSGFRISGHRFGRPEADHGRAARE
jgi:hypothetical protein